MASNSNWRPARPRTCHAVSVQLLGHSNSDLSSEGTGFPCRPAALSPVQPRCARGTQPRRESGRAVEGKVFLFLLHTKNPPDGSNLSLLRSESKQDLYHPVCAFICCIRSSLRIVPLQNTPAHKGILRDNSPAEKTAAQWSRYHSQPRRESIIPPRRSPSAGDRCASVRPLPSSPPRLHRRVRSTDARWHGLLRVICSNLDGSSCGLLDGNL